MSAILERMIEQLCFVLCEIDEVEPHQLLWSGHPTPEPECEVRHTYEDKAKKILDGLSFPEVIDALQKAEKILEKHEDRMFAHLPGSEEVMEYKTALYTVKTILRKVLK